MGWRNMQDFRPMWTVVPVRPVRFDSDCHGFLLACGAGATLWFDPLGHSGTHVGDELDFTVAFPVQQQLKILCGYCLFLSGEHAKNAPGKDNQHFFYLQTRVDF